MSPAAGAARPVSLLVDARYLGAAGLGRYTREIAGRLLDDPRFGPITLAGDVTAVRDWLGSLGSRTDRLRVVALPARSFHPSVQARWMVHRLHGRLSADVAFFPHYDVPVLGHPRISVVAVHDLTHFRVPGAFPAWKRVLGGRLLGFAARTATCVITGSRSAKDDLIGRFSGRSARVEVVPHGVEPFFSPPDGPPPPEIARLQPYLLCVGDRKPHKNHRAAVEVLRRLRERGYADLRLVLAGGDASHGDDIGADLARDKNVRDAVVLPGRVSDTVLRDLYRHCAAFLFPSLYEGFGLPPLEAMACGAPVVASDRAAVPEVVGDGGIVVDVADIDAWTAATASVLDPGERRADLVACGIRRAAEFRWDDAAARTAELLLDAAHSSESRGRHAASTASSAAS